MFSRNKLFLGLAFLAAGLFTFSQTSLAEETIVPALSDVNLNDSTRLDSDTPISLAPVVQTAETERVTVRGFYVDPPDYPALPEVEGTRINSGKKTNFAKPEDLPTVVNNNYREVVATIPGLIVSEEPSSPIVNFGYRGFDSQRSEFTQLLKDGISIKNEQFGFPESHYAPILDSVERIEFVRGGSALQYGCQPGGALNFITKMPRRDAPFHFETKNAYGTDDLFTSYTAIDGTSGPLGYYVFYDHREREGFRENSDYDLNAGSGKFVYDLSGDSRLILTGDFYYEEHGEPGGLRRFGDPAGDPLSVLLGGTGVYYEEGRNQISRMFDRFRLTRYYGSLEYQKDFSEATQLDITAFGGYLSRWSQRQRGGGFGTIPTGGAAATNTIQDRKVWNEGVDARLRHDYQLAGDTSTFAGGVYFYHALQERTDKRGATPFAEDSNDLRNLALGETWNGSIFAENRFHFGRLSIVPGFRFEFLDTSLDEEINVAKTTANPPFPLGEESDFTVVPLFGLGISYVLVEGTQTSTTEPATTDPKHYDSKKSAVATVTEAGLPRLELFGNVSQGYRPRTYGELVPTSANGFVNSNLEEGHSWEAEIGLRGRPLPYLKFELSGFYIRFDDQIAEFTATNPAPPPAQITVTDNVGDARYWGVEASMELDVLAMLNGGAESPFGSLNLYANVVFLDAEFIAGPFEGNTPVFAADYLLKTGAIYRWKDTVKVGFIGTMIDDHYATADNAYQRFIPAYQVWDLTAEVNFCHGRIGVFAGVGNLFDEDFWAEARDEGIVPAYGRNYYAGVSLKF
ncbi:MAG TPA: TonB-dependent receptor plug domain-containing protein [Chthoniobacterales bacterium]|nr:TonB-dependent receptor plug domain-containing protein [Chthoniobacterales bacterium]